MKRRLLAALARFRRPIIAAGSAYGVLTFLMYPALFWLGIVVVLVVALVVAIDQRDEVTAAWADEVFVSAGLNAKLAQRDKDFAAVTARLSEVLRDHAECPVPVVPTPDVIDDAWLELLVTGATDVTS